MGNLGPISGNGVRLGYKVWWLTLVSLEELLAVCAAALAFLWLLPGSLHVFLLGSLAEFLRLALLGLHLVSAETALAGPEMIA